MLRIEDLHTYRGESYVLQGVALTVDEGTCTTLLGRNGMGKTTLIRSVMGLTPPRSGSIRWRTDELMGLAPHEVARRGLALVPQGRRIFPSLTVEENLTLAARSAASGQRSWTLERVYDLFENLPRRRRNRGGDLSGGEQQMLAIGRALMTSPSLLLMDEPSEGLSPVIVDRVEAAIGVLRKEGMSILLVEQNYKLGVGAADAIFILSTGRVVWSGSPVALEADEAARKEHLGV